MDGEAVLGFGLGRRWTGLRLRGVKGRFGRGEEWGFRWGNGAWIRIVWRWRKGGEGRRCSRLKACRRGGKGG